MSDLSGLGGVIQYKWQYNNGASNVVYPLSKTKFTIDQLHEYHSLKRVEAGDEYVYTPN